MPGIPSENEPEPLLRIEALRALGRSDVSARFRDLVLDPVLLAAHVGNLPTSSAPGASKRLEPLRARAREEGPLSLSPAEWRLLAADRDSMQPLHRQAWQHWPVESWDLGREEPQLPPETPNRAPRASPYRARAPELNVRSILRETWQNASGEGICHGARLQPKPSSNPPAARGLTDPAVLRLGTMFALSVKTLSPLSERQLPGPQAFRGQTLVVALVTSWSPPTESELVRLRSELRCLSTVLVLIGPEQLACFQPNDTRRPGQPTAPCERQDFDALLGPRVRAGHGTNRHQLRLVIVNPSGAIAWSHDGQAVAPTIESLIAALSQARRHLLAGPGRTYGITRSDLMASLTSAFATTFGSDRPLGSLTRAAEPQQIWGRVSGDRG